MKTYSQFREDVYFARENLMLKSKYLSPRASKLRALKDRTGGANELWSGLECFDLFS